MAAVSGLARVSCADPQHRFVKIGISNGKRNWLTGGAEWVCAWKLHCDQNESRAVN